MKLLSDIHTEFGKSILKQINITDDILILAGDIGVGKHVIPTLQFFADKFSHVIYVPGNHEYYGYTIEFVDDYIQTHKPSNVHFLNPGTVTINGTTFTGCTLWTDFHNQYFDKSQINDFRIIKNFTAQKAKDLHAIHRQYIKDNPADVYVTHFLPHPHLVSPRYKTSPLTPYFAPNLEDIIQTLPPTTWMFGHTHDSVNTHFYNTHFLCNPYGYENYATNPDFQV